MQVLAEATEGMSHDEIRSAIAAALAELNTEPGSWGPWVREVFDDVVVYEWEGTLFRSTYEVDDEGTATLGAAEEVRVTYTPVGSEEAASFDPHDGGTRRALVEALKGDERFRGEVAAVLERISDGEHPLVDLVESTPAATLERAVDGDGRARIKLIEPGWGSSGYYGRTVLERDGAKAYPSGTKMYWNHPTRTEERERPEGDLDKLAAELTSDATFDPAGADGPGLYADAIVFEKYRDTVEELAPHIGVSIRGRGRVTPGTAEGKTGPIIDELVDGYSVDFVTLPGAGGKVAELFEAAGRGARTVDDPKEGPKVDDLKEAQDRADAAERERDEAKERAERAEAALIMAEARRRAAEIVADEKLPAIVATRVVESAAGDPPVTEAGELDVEKLTEAVKAAAKAEREYLAKATGSGKVTALGESGDPLEEGGNDEADDFADELKAVAESMGLDDDASKIFVGGRS